MNIRNQTFKKFTSLRFYTLYFAIAMVFILSPTLTSAEILLADDFENFNHSNNIWSFKNTSSNSPFKIVFDSTKAHSGNGVLELRYDPNTTGPGFEIGQFSKQVGEVYYRWYMKWSADWTWSAIGQKTIKLQPLNGGPMYNYTTEWGGSTIEIHVEQEAFSTDDIEQNEGNAVAFQRDRWYCLEAYVKQDTGQGNAALKVWIDDVLKLDHSGLRLADSFSPIGQVLLSGYYNEGGATPNGVPHLQYSWHDDHVASTQRIGCSPTAGGGTSLNPPTGLRVIE